MAAETETKIPAPIYAAAAVGDMAYQQLRKLPATVAELRGRVGTDLDTDKLRGMAQRNVAALRTSAQAAQERAQAIYTRLVAHGEEVVRSRRVIRATIGTESPAEGASEATPAEPAAVEATKES
jgi:hypothetical protein